VNWKTDLKLADLDGRQAIEVTCRACGQTRTDTASVLMALPDLKQAYLDEVERALKCSSRFCRGRVRIALIHDGKNEGFVGGMA
jgi:hypothetical protein